MKISVQYAYISYSGSSWFFLGQTAEALEKKIADHCRQYWNDGIDESVTIDTPIPESDAKVIEEYLKRQVVEMEEYGEQELELEMTQ